MSRIFPLNPKTVPLAYEALRRGDLVVLPTDTVYGVAASAHQPEAIARLFEAKGRDGANPIPLLLSDPDRIDRVCVSVPDAVRRLALAFWPGPLTMALPKAPDLPDALSPLPTVGVRVPDHDLTRAIIRAMGGALAVTSANRSGGAEALSVGQAYGQLGAAVTYYMDGGPAPGGTPSTVITFNDVGVLQIVRPGPISEAMLRAVAGC
ncbi:MAG: threonylcarbamoyl-AMP synthase [Anaerolineae bacterium]|nr:threonylcarbamoyl-AMP synthase [Anaerolineae bacterium]